jgi:hypothetical protein
MRRRFSWRRVRLWLWCIVFALLMIVELWLIIHIAEVSLIHEHEHGSAEPRATAAATIDARGGMPETT